MLYVVTPIQNHLFVCLIAYSSMGSCTGVDTGGNCVSSYLMSNAVVQAQVQRTCAVNCHPDLENLPCFHSSYTLHLVLQEYAFQNYCNGRLENCICNVVKEKALLARDSNTANSVERVNSVCLSQVFPSFSTNELWVWMNSIESRSELSAQGIHLPTPNEYGL